MGLDQYATAVKGEDKIELKYWRKHANLNGWMERLWKAKGNSVEFNCEDLELTKQDLLALRAELYHLPTATGFFWGTSQPYQDKDTEEFVERALELINKGYTILYSCWW